MAAVRAFVIGDMGMPHAQSPGDLLLGSDNILGGAISTAGAGTWTAAAIVNGIINRTGPTGGYTDTTDTAANILTAISGNSNAANVVPGVTFRLDVRNTVAQALTFAAGTGVVAGTGTLNIANSLVREYILTVLSTCQPQQFQMTGNSGSPNLYFGYAVGVAGAVPATTVTIPLQGSNGTVGTVGNLGGATITGTNTGSGAVVIGLIEGVGGLIGVVASVNNSGAVNGAVSFGPTIQIDSLGTYGL